MQLIVRDILEYTGTISSDWSLGSGEWLPLLLLSDRVNTAMD